MLAKIPAFVRITLILIQVNIVGFVIQKESTAEVRFQILVLRTTRQYST
jgi:hypothetical protein